MQALKIITFIPITIFNFLTRLDIGDRALAYLMVFPAAVLILLFAIYPMIQGFIVSFKHVEPATYEMTNIGFDNYRDLYDEELFLESLQRTIKLVVVGNVIQLALGLGISLLVHQELIGRNIARGVVLFPYLVPAVVIALTWRYMLDPTLGILNKQLVDFGFIDRPYPFLTRPSSALYVVIFAGIWKYTPFFVIMLLARLQVIPTEIEEAARLDGANRWQLFYHITLPWLMPVIIIALLLRTIWTFNEFEMVYLFAFGGPRFATTTLPVLVNHFARNTQNLGLAAATATVMVAILFVLSWIYFILYDRAEERLY